MSKKHTKYSASEKAKIALEAVKDHMTTAQIVAKYSVHATQVNKWRKQLVEQAPELFSNKTNQLMTDHTKELTMLYEQIGRLKVENEFLKKKSDLFS